MGPAGVAARGGAGDAIDARNAGAVFQAASQFNCLEMTGPGVSPRQGIAGYALDPTQVMARSLSPLRRTSGDCWWLWCPAFHVC